jgi:aromatic ring-opening dioxygenase LigB subunit
MLICIQNDPNVKVDDYIAVTKNDRFIGYMTIKEKMNESMLVDADKEVVQMMNELQCKDIPYSLEIK